MSFELPPELQGLAASWGFEATEELPGGHCSRIFANEHMVMKAPFQGEEMTSGFAGAYALQQAGGPKIYQADPASAVLLMERLVPGTLLCHSGLSETECQSVFTDIALRIGRLPAQGATDLGDYYGVDHPLLDRLLTSTTERRFLHGDLHHENIANHCGQWRPIDPKGLVGDPNFEVVAFLRNPLARIPLVDDLEHFTWSRIQALAVRLQLDPWRMAAWGLIDRLESAEGPVDDPWTRLYGAFVAIEERLRPV